jgi:2-methylaconitate cis-trans-isomerase PrpF
VLRVLVPGRGFMPSGHRRRLAIGNVADCETSGSSTPKIKLFARIRVLVGNNARGNPLCLVQDQYSSRHRALMQNNAVAMSSASALRGTIEGQDP